MFVCVDFGELVFRGSTVKMSELSLLIWLLLAQVLFTQLGNNNNNHFSVIYCVSTVADCINVTKIFIFFLFACSVSSSFVYSVELST